MIGLIDTHIHFDDDRFDHDRESVYNKAISAGVKAMVIPATTQNRWDKVFSLAAQYKAIYPTAGLHPAYIAEHTDEHLSLLESQLQHPDCVAIGECGLDGFIKGLDYNKQQSFFSAQINLAAELQLPLIIHARNAVQDVTQALKSAGKHTTGVIHSYNGSLQQAQLLIDLGFRLSFGGAVTYDRATRLKSTIQALPLESIMVETDAPDQPVQSHGGERNEPACLTEVVATIAEIKNISAEEVAIASNSNACHLFNLPHLPEAAN